MRRAHADRLGHAGLPCTGRGLSFRKYFSEILESVLDQSRKASVADRSHENTDFESNTTISYMCVLSRVYLH